VIALACPGCVRTLHVRDDLAGKRVRCPSCQHIVLVPNGTTPTEPAVTEGAAVRRDAPMTFPAGPETVDFAPSSAAQPQREPGASRAPVRQVPGFEILEEVGRGGMGLILKARQSQPRRIVALKMLHGGAFALPESRARFVAEAEAVAKLQHPNIVQLHAAGEVEGHPYLVMEYIDGGTLADRLAGKPLPWRQAAELLERLARAADYAHRKGIIHRDLKPSNVLFATGDEPKIVDFGLAKEIEAAVSVAAAGPRTRTGALLGTPAYMAPEQAQANRGPIGPAADVYALGAVLYECLTGQRPFAADATVDLLVKVVSEEPVPPRRLAPGIPADLETICLKCLAKLPAARYESAQALADDLRALLDGAPIAARPPGALERFGRWLKRRQEIAYLIGGAAAAVVVVAVVMAMRPGEETRNAAQVPSGSDGQPAANQLNRDTQDAGGSPVLPPDVNPPTIAEAARRQTSNNNLRQLSLALATYEGLNGEFPPAVIYSKDGRNRPLYSWRVAILPYVEVGNLYGALHKDEPWDSPHNAMLLDQMPKVFRFDVAKNTKGNSSQHETYYQAIVGPGAAFDPAFPAGLKRVHFTDGMSSTIMLVEAKKAVPWSAPQDVTFDPKGPLPELGGLFDDGFHVALADGETKFIKRTISPATVKAAITRAGGEILDAEWWLPAAPRPKLPGPPVQRGP
jgi:hypothetical protein